jgi:hypothetical protein
MKSSYTADNEKPIPTNIIVNPGFYSRGANSETRQRAPHVLYHLTRKKDPKQNNPYTFADSAMAKKPVVKPKKKTR